MRRISEFLWDRGFFFNNIPKNRRGLLEIWPWLEDKQRAHVLELFKRLPKNVILRSYKNDPFMQNFMLNGWEYARGLARLESKPWNISLPIADVCNARCVFCTSWLEGKDFLPLEKIEAFKEVLKTTRLFGLAGHGEPCTHPHFKEMLLVFKRFLDPRCHGYIITNGVKLEPFIKDLFDARIKTFNISLNASDSLTHEKVMGLGMEAFEKVVNNILLIRDYALQNNINYPYLVSISMVVTRDNIHQIEDFIQLGLRLKVSSVYFKTLAGQTSANLPGLNYHLLPPYLHPDFQRLLIQAKHAINLNREKLKIVADINSWAIPIFPLEVEEHLRNNPPIFISREQAIKDKELRKVYRNESKYHFKSRGAFVEKILDDDGENPFGRHPRYPCASVYSNLYINDFSYRMVPCCYMGQVPGHQPIIWDGSYDFMFAWNSEAMVNLRSRLLSGPLFRMCSRCPTKY